MKQLTSRDVTRSLATFKVSATERESTIYQELGISSAWKRYQISRHDFQSFWKHIQHYSLGLGLAPACFRFAPNPAALKAIEWTGIYHAYLLGLEISIFIAHAPVDPGWRILGLMGTLTSQYGVNISDMKPCRKYTIIYFCSVPWKESEQVDR